MVGDAKLAKTGFGTQGDLTRYYFELMAGSPAINKGMSLAEVNVDMYKNIREGKPDMGALELGTVTQLEGPDKDNKSILVHPNPAQDELFLSGALLGDEFYEITTLVGKTVQTGTLRKQAISIESLLAGFYLIKIKADRSESVQRFVKE